VTEIGKGTGNTAQQVYPDLAADQASLDNDQGHALPLPSAPLSEKGTEQKTGKETEKEATVQATETGATKPLEGPQPPQTLSSPSQTESEQQVDPLPLPEAPADSLSTLSFWEQQTVQKVVVSEEEKQEADSATSRKKEEMEDKDGEGEEQQQQDDQPAIQLNTSPHPRIPPSEALARRSSSSATVSPPSKSTSSTLVTGETEKHDPPLVQDSSSAPISTSANPISSSLAPLGSSAHSSQKPTAEEHTQPSTKKHSESNALRKNRAF